MESNLHSKQHDVSSEQHDVSSEQHDVSSEQHDVSSEQYDVSSEQYEVSSKQFTPRSTNCGLVSAAFDSLTPTAPEEGATKIYKRREGVHPQHFWVVAGLGPVPHCLRAPQDKFRELTSVEQLGDYLGGVVWYVTDDQHNFIEERSLADLIEFVGRHNWIGVIDVRDDGTANAENLRTRPHGTLGVFVPHPPQRSDTQKPYFEVTNGELLAISNWPIRRSDTIVLPNAARGKWYWRTMCHFRFPEQLVVWHESVDGNDGEYQSLLRYNYEDVTALRQWQSVNLPLEPLDVIRQKWAAASVAAQVVADVVGLSDLSDTLPLYLAVDPNSTYWSAGEMSDGYLLYADMTRCNGFTDGAANGYRTKEIEDAWTEYHREAVPQGASVDAEGLFYLMLKHKPNTNLLVSARLRSQ